MYKIVLLLLLPLFLFANSAEQSECISEVKEIARQYTKYYTTIVAMAMKETSCLYKQVIGDDNTSFGVLQVQLRTAREELGFIPELSHLAKLTDTKLRSSLLADRHLNIRITCHRFERYRKSLGYKKAVQAHNGLKGNYRYFYKVEYWKKWILAQR